MKNKIITTALALAALVSPLLHAATLALGDPAPEIKAAKWIKGDPVLKLDPERTYVIEFWATWCGPCIHAIPHLTELAHQYKKDVTFIGMAVRENGDLAEKEAKVTQFVTKMGDKMDYAVALDDGDFTGTHWMKAADRRGIPTSFVVHKGIITWIGHPMGGLSEALGEITGGTFDLGKAKQRAAIVKKLYALQELAEKGGDEAELKKLTEEYEEMAKGYSGKDAKEFPTAQEIIQRVKRDQAESAYTKAREDGADADQIAKLEAAVRAANPEGWDFEAFKKSIDRSVAAKPANDLFEAYYTLISEGDDPAKIAEVAKQFETAALKLNDPELLNSLAWNLLTWDIFKVRDLPLATRLAKAAVDASEVKEAAFLDTYARALFDSGNREEAIQYQIKAVAACTDTSDKEELEATLKEYQKGAAK
jgi:thiol-disulfide isomerase/thioredoxin